MFQHSRVNIVYGTPTQHNIISISIYIIVWDGAGYREIMGIIVVSRHCPVRRSKQSRNIVGKRKGFSPVMHGVKDYLPNVRTVPMHSDLRRLPLPQSVNRLLHGRVFVVRPADERRIAVLKPADAAADIKGVIRLVGAGRQQNILVIDSQSVGDPDRVERRLHTFILISV